MATITRQEAVSRLLELVGEVQAAKVKIQNAAGSLLEAVTAQQAARTIEKESEAALTLANAEIIGPRKCPPEERERFLRSAMADTYRARAMAEEALKMAEAEKSIAEKEYDAVTLEARAYTAILYALTMPDASDAAQHKPAHPSMPF
jgi:hypothetical protein